MIVQHFFDPQTWTLTYVVHDSVSGLGVVIDPITNYDPASGRTSQRSNELVTAYVERHGIELRYVLDTHVHADHLSGMAYFKERHGARSVIGWNVGLVQTTFRDIFNLGPSFPTDGRQFDVLLRDGQTLESDRLRIQGLHTPGHTPACMTYRIGDALFVGDVLFAPDYGVARCDFPGGSAEALWDSVQRLYALPDELRVFTCHDYLPGGRELRFASTIGEQKRSNAQLSARTERDAFLALRKQRDAELAMPALILPSVQVNVRAGQLPEPESNGVSYLKIPLNRL